MSLTYNTTSVLASPQTAIIHANYCQIAMLFRANRSGRFQLLALLLSPQISMNSISPVRRYYSTPILGQTPVTPILRQDIL